MQMSHFSMRHLKPSSTGGAKCAYHRLLSFRPWALRGSFKIPPSQPVIMPSSNPDLRGTHVQVWVFVDEAGRVVADSTRLEPPTRNRDLNRRLIREASEWVFRPAQQDGKAVASWFPYRISM